MTTNQEHMRALNHPQLRAIESDQRGDLSGVSMPPPVSQDWQVSPVDGPDWSQQHFTGGVEKIERKNDMLIFHFAAGGQVCVNHGVTYVAPERH